MRTIIHDLGKEYSENLATSADHVIYANGHYAPCQGCFKCWTRNPGSCVLKDALQQVCRVLGTSDELTIITGNTYGGYSAAIKNLLDRSIGTSTPFSSYRGGQMHHTLRYGKLSYLRVIAYGDMTEEEQRTFTLMAQRNALNMGYQNHSIVFCKSAEEAGELA